MSPTRSHPGNCRCHPSVGRGAAGVLLQANRGRHKSLYWHASVEVESRVVKTAMIIPNYPLFTGESLESGILRGRIFVGSRVLLRWERQRTLIVCISRVSPILQSIPYFTETGGSLAETSSLRSGECDPDSLVATMHGGEDIRMHFSGGNSHQ